MAIIWALRQLIVGKKIRIRDAYYQGMSPLVPFALVLVVIGFQLIPLLIGSAIYSTVMTNGIAIDGGEKFLFAAVFVLLALVSLYFVSSSVFALYIVTLSDMTPMKALKNARALVRGRRWRIIPKVLFLPVALFVVAASLLLPFIIGAPALAQSVFFVLSMFGLVVAHTYLYTLYRELLHE